MKTYLVGGAVRDELLGLPVKERDWVVVGASPEELIKQGFIPVGKFFPVFLHPQTKEEYALARMERKVAGGYHGFTFNTANTISLEEDLARRDITINAMAKTTDGKLIDPYGGQKDLQAKLLRHVSPAFAEDPVRVLRIARFAARFAPLGFKVAPQTLALMQQMVARGELNFLVAERVWKEMERALQEPSPVQFIKVLKGCNALNIILPELAALYGVPQPPEHHPEIDTGIHVELVLEQATLLSKDPKVRFAALMHDLGKGQTPAELWPKHHGHEARSEKLILQLCQRLGVPKEYKALAQIVGKNHGECHRINDKATASQILTLLEKCDAFRRPERFELFLQACICDAKGRPGFEQVAYPAADILRAVQQSLKSLDIAAIRAEMILAVQQKRQQRALPPLAENSLKFIELLKRSIKRKRLQLIQTVLDNKKIQPTV